MVVATNSRVGQCDVLKIWDVEIKIVKMGGRVDGR